VYQPNQMPQFFDEPKLLLPMPSFAQGIELTVEQVFGWLIVG
jgi:Uma2 family endonuclease